MKTSVWLGGPVSVFAVVAAASYSVSVEHTVGPPPMSAVETIALGPAPALDGRCAGPTTRERQRRRMLR